jgi:hypothetical protein
MTRDANDKTVRVTCGKCQAALRMSTKWPTGKRLRCPKCGHGFRVVRRSGCGLTDTPTAATPEPKAPAIDEHLTTRRRTRMPVRAGMVTLGVVCGLLMASLVLWPSRSKPAAVPDVRGKSVLEAFEILAEKNHFLVQAPQAIRRPSDGQTAPVTQVCFLEEKTGKYKALNGGKASGPIVLESKTKMPRGFLGKRPDQVRDMILDAFLQPTFDESHGKVCAKETTREPGTGRIIEQRIWRVGGAYWTDRQGKRHPLRGGEELDAGTQVCILASPSGGQSGPSGATARRKPH